MGPGKTGRGEDVGMDIDAVAGRWIVDLLGSADHQLGNFGDLRLIEFGTYWLDRIQHSISPRGGGVAPDLRSGLLSTVLSSAYDVVWTPREVDAGDNQTSPFESLLGFKEHRPYNPMLPISKIVDGSLK